MKSLKLLFVAVLAMVATSVSAQGPQGQQGQRPQRQRMTVEQRTQMQVDRQTKNLDLTEEQQKKLYDYYLGINKKQQEEMEARMKAMREGQQQGQHSQSVSHFLFFLSQIKNRESRRNPAFTAKTHNGTDPE